MLIRMMCYASFFLSRFHSLSSPICCAMLYANVVVCCCWQEFGDDFTMVLSTDSFATDDPSSKSGPSDFVVDAVSDMSIPSIDRDGLLSEATPVPNVGVPLSEADCEKQRKVEASKSRSLLQSALDGIAVDIDGGSQVGTASAINGLDVEGAAAANNNNNTKKRSANKALQSSLGVYGFAQRYHTRPADNIVLAVAMVSAHHDMDAREQTMASFWLETWDDCSRDYKLLRRRGGDLAGF